MSALSTAIIEVRTSPHLRAPLSVEVIMRNVVFALMPLCFFAVWAFGLSAAALILTTTGACLFTERMACRLSGKPSSLGDFSAAITGILLGLVLPPGLPLWMGAVGGFIAIAPGKMVFGGLGFNVFNPALVGRAFLQAAFPVAISSYRQALAPDRFTDFIPSTLAWPFMKGLPDTLSTATPLVQQKFDHITIALQPLFIGERAGSTGETSALLILLCGLYLILRRIMDWRIPLAMLLSAFLTGTAFRFFDPARYPDPLFVVLSGGLMLGAMFMATDPVGSPVTPRGVWIYGALMGFITVIIRFKGGLPEGVMYAILLGNAVSPLIDNLTQPKTYGARAKA